MNPISRCLPHKGLANYRDDTGTCTLAVRKSGTKGLPDYLRLSGQRTKRGKGANEQEKNKGLQSPTLRLWGCIINVLHENPLVCLFQFAIENPYHLASDPFVRNRSTFANRSFTITIMEN